MNSVTGYTLTDAQSQRAAAAIDPAMGFLESRDEPLGAALIRRAWHDGPAADVVTALSAYQNADGGFGMGLEVDIASPVSNPFAARLAMQALREISLTPPRRCRIG